MGSIALIFDDSCGFDAIFDAIGFSCVVVVVVGVVPVVDPDDVPVVDPLDDVGLVDPLDVVVVEPEGAVDVLWGLPCVEVVVVFGLLVVFGPLVVGFGLEIVGLVAFGLPCVLGPCVCGAAPFGPAVTGTAVSDAIATTLRASRVACMAVSLRCAVGQSGYRAGPEMWTIIGRNFSEADVVRDRIGSLYTLFE